MRRKVKVKQKANQRAEYERFNAELSRAQTRLAEKDVNGAQAILKRVLAGLPPKARERGEVLGLMGLAYSMAEQFDRSYHVLTEALTFLPNDPMLWYNRGISSRLSTRLGRSLRDFERAAQLDTPGALAKELAEALAVSREMVQRELALRGPDFTLEQLIEQETLFHAVNERMVAHAWPEAEQGLRQVIALADVLPQPHGNLGLCLLMQNRLEEAETELRRALEIDPDYELARRQQALLEETRRTGQLPAEIGFSEPLAGRGLQLSLTIKPE